VVANVVSIQTDWRSFGKEHYVLTGRNIIYFVSNLNREPQVDGLLFAIANALS
jgi:hypothetical protein